MIEWGSFLGAGLATAAAIAFASQYLFVRVGTTDGSVSDVMLVSLVCNVVVVLPLGLALTPVRVTTVSVFSFVAAGIVGSLLARVLEFQSIQKIGASRTSPIVAANVLFATVLAVIVLDESVSARHFSGIILVVVGVAVLSWETSANDESILSVRDAGVALSLPLLAAIFIALEPIFVNYGYNEGTSVLTGFGVKAVAGLVGFATYRWLVSNERVTAVLHQPGLVYHVGAGLANTAGVGLYFAALAVAPVSIVMPLLQSGPLFVLVLSAVFLPRHLERITPRLIAAAVTIVVGAMLVSIS
ncbi:DMT family transporter [Haloarcula marina]|uniref:DMT family transporter n=1 Tax=Haloarcula marina TaxID=2961574 RepID=UPI0020B6F8C8|nr:EamA family transporter [Halomicroarcula marina]